MIEFEALLTENELAQEFLAALKQRYLAEKFFYWSPLSVRAWLDLCQGTQPYKNFWRSQQLLSRHADDIARRFHGERMEVVSLGAGQGDKDVIFLEALRSKQSFRHYRPVDSSQALLEMALTRARQSGCAARGLKADLERLETSEALATTADAPRLYLVLGNTLGISDPRKFLETLKLLLRREDYLLLDGEIFDPQVTMASYNNPVNRRFAFSPLASLGLEEGRDGALVLQSGIDPHLEGLYLVTKHFRAARQLKIPVAAQRVTLQADERLGMSASYKYSRETFYKLLRETGGLRPLCEYLSEDEHFVLVLAAQTP